MEDTRSQSQKGISLQMKMTWRCPGYVKRGPRGSRKKIPSGGTDGMLGNAHMVSYVQFYPNRGRKTKEVRQISRRNLKQRDGKTIEEFLERFKVETGRMKGAPECMRFSGFMHEVNNPELTKRLNEHVPKTMKEMMIATTPSYEEKPPLLAKRKVTHHGGHRTSQRRTLQSGGLTSEVSQKKDGGLAGLPPYKNTQRNPRGRSRKVQTATAYGNPCGEEKQQQVLRLPQ
ncbi:hypothetical protein Tco_1478856 [Tanacetum coccineum]